jgi:hypothetical protein
VRLNRGAGAGCTTPSRVSNVPRATLWGCDAASSMDSTGAKHTSVASISSHHSSRVRERKTSASFALSAGQVERSICPASSGSPSRPVRFSSSA